MGTRILASHLGRDPDQPVYRGVPLLLVQPECLTTQHVETGNGTGVAAPGAQHSSPLPFIKIPVPDAPEMTHALCVQKAAQEAGDAWAALWELEERPPKPREGAVMAWLGSRVADPNQAPKATREEEIGNARAVKDAAVDRLAAARADEAAYEDRRRAAERKQKTEADQEARARHARKLIGKNSGRSVGRQQGSLQALWGAKAKDNSDPNDA